MYDRLVSETADPWFGGRIDAFFSALEIPFPGNGDRSRQRLGSNGQLLRRKPEHLVLAGPDIAPKPKPDRLASVFGMALAMAVIILAITAWASRDWAAPTPPTETIYGQHVILY